MTLEEAKKVADIVGQCDYGCSTCIEPLLRMLNTDFPEFIWTRPNYDVIVSENPESKSETKNF